MFKLVALLLLLAVVTAQQGCTLNQNQLGDKSRVYVKEDSSGERSLLLRNSLEPGERLYLLCPPTDIVVAQCQGNSVFDKAFPPATECNTPKQQRVQVLVDAITDLTCSKLGGQLYKVGYDIRKRFREVFQSCYDPATQHLFYTKHKTYKSPNQSSDQLDAFCVDALRTIKTPAAYRADNLFKRFGSLFGARQTYATNDGTPTISPTQLIPCIDFLTHNLKNLTLRPENIVPLFDSVHRNWATIEKWARNLPAGASVATVVSGTYDTLSLAHSINGRPMSVSLERGARPVPKWIYKVVRYENGEPTVVVLHNNPFGNRASPLCTLVACPNELQGELSDNVQDGYTFCCSIGEFAQIVGSQARAL